MGADQLALTQKAGILGLKRNLLQNLVALDSGAFTAVVRRIGFVAAACYRLHHQHWTLVIATQSGSDAKKTEAGFWPVSVTHVNSRIANCTSNYTREQVSGLPLGWTKINVSNSNTLSMQNDWPKGANFYFPEQETFDEKLLIVTINPAGKRSRNGEINANLEVLAARLRGLLQQTALRAELSEAAFTEHITALGSDFHRMLDHELRTPMASVVGYAALLGEVDPSTDMISWIEYRNMIQEHTAQVLTMLDKLSLSLQKGVSLPENETMERIDVATLLQDLCARMKVEAPSIIGDEAAERTIIRFQKLTDQSCFLLATPRLLVWSIWEVLKNAVIHAKAGRVDATIYSSNDMIIIDIADDGEGVALGSEELIFLRFYQDLASLTARKGRRGLGLGLFLARRIAERHLGQLIYSRVRGRSGVFRFLWPMAAEETKIDITKFTA